MTSKVGTEEAVEPNGPHDGTERAAQRNRAGRTTEPSGPHDGTERVPPGTGPVPDYPRAKTPGTERVGTDRAAPWNRVGRANWDGRTQLDIYKVSSYGPARFHESSSSRLAAT